MAEVLGIPAPFLGKVLQPLVSHGVLYSQRGRSGGFRLARDPSEIKLRQIVETQEQLDRARQCILGQSECNDHEVCPLHAWWSQTTEKFFEMLDNTTLEEMAVYQAQHPGCRYPLPTQIELPRAPLPTHAPAQELSVPTP
jgi:Rrf2 family transcriptional regulator, iron-sulfur cluster assembly transcription factor